MPGKNLLLDAMYEVPDEKDVSEVVVGKKTVEDGEKPVYKKSKTKKKASTKKADKAALKDAKDLDKKAV